MVKNKKSIKKKLSKSHREKISNGLKKYHKTCKRSKSKSKTDTEMKSFLKGLKTNSADTDKFLEGIVSGSNKSKKKQLQKEIQKLKMMINKN